MSDTRNQIIVEEDRVIIYDGLAEEVIHDGLEWSDDEDAARAFLELFEVIKSRGHILADPDEDYYQGINVMRVIRRKSDWRLFGYQYWTPVSKHGEAYIESNGDEHGFEFDAPAGFDWDNDYVPSVYVWLPVEPFTITGYKITKENSK